ncbi:MAG: TetR/AcrR family transcriptional regulator [Tannerellaceae bacterium]|nr:TetR/AcrR family transcriptional regulator [Tannerellaceae bacterium]
MIREQILLTAFDLFSQYGIKKVSMDDIARSLRISKRTLYEYFTDKETLLVQGIWHNSNRLVEMLEDFKKGPYTALDVILLFYIEIMKRPRWYNKQYYEDLKKYPEAIRANEEIKSGFLQECKALFDRGVKEDVFRPEVNIEIMGLLAKEQLKMLQPSKSFCSHSNMEVYNTVLFTFLRGACTEKGQQILQRYAVKLSYNLQ